ncbi:MAG: DUF2516 family protein [Pseudonocardiales bacterium]|nr:DUF2516 family protein [Pseudonocardiales bacterium]
MLACWVVGIPVGLFAVVDAARVRADAFTAADKLTKPTWLWITGGALAVLLIFRDGPMSLLWLVGLIAALVYLVDVRPSLIEVQGGRR